MKVKTLNCHTQTHTPQDLSSDLTVLLKMIKWLQFNVFIFFDRSGCLFTLIWSNVSNAAIFSTTTASRVPSSCICSLFLCFSVSVSVSCYTIWSAVFKACIVVTLCSWLKLWLFYSCSALIFSSQKCHALSAIVWCSTAGSS